MSRTYPNGLTVVRDGKKGNLVLAVVYLAAAVIYLVLAWVSPPNRVVALVFAVVWAVLSVPYFVWWGEKQHVVRLVFPSGARMRVADGSTQQWFDELAEDLSVMEPEVLARYLQAVRGRNEFTWA